MEKTKCRFLSRKSLIPITLALQAQVQNITPTLVSENNPIPSSESAFELIWTSVQTKDKGCKTLGHIHATFFGQGISSWLSIHNVGGQSGQVGYFLCCSSEWSMNESTTYMYQEENSSEGLVHALQLHICHRGCTGLGGWADEAINHLILWPRLSQQHQNSTEASENYVDQGRALLCH